MQGIKRKVVYVALYELFAILFTTVGLTLLSDQNTAHASVAAIASTLVAIVWNMLYNTLFEWWEAKQPGRGRNLWRRVAHAIGFEGGLVIMLVPLFAWWLQVSLWHAFVVDLGLIVFFLVYTFVYNLCFDRVFGLPASAQASQA